MSDDQLDELKRTSREMLAKGFIVPSTVPCAAPVFFRPKTDGSLRSVIDCRRLNNMNIKDGCPLHRIQDQINRLGKAQWFSELNLQSGYHGVRVAREDQWQDSFKTRYRQSGLSLLPFGLPVPFSD